MRAPHAAVLYRDAAWLALDKPAGILTTPLTATSRDSLVHRARSIAPNAAMHHPLSRLDVDVTGVVLFALTRAAVTQAETARTRGMYKRVYVALLPAAPEPFAGAWSWSIAPHPTSPHLRSTAPHAEAKPAHTVYRTLASSHDVALLLARPVTGRTHQIRVHAAMAGVPVLGDLAYHGARRLILAEGAVVSAPRVLLHAWAVDVPDGNRVVSPWPQDIIDAWVSAGGLASNSEDLGALADFMDDMAAP